MARENPRLFHHAVQHLLFLASKKDAVQKPGNAGFDGFSGRHFVNAAGGLLLTMGCRSQSNTLLISLYLLR